MKIKVPASHIGGIPFLKLTLLHLSHEKNPPTFHCTGLLIGILIMVVYYIPYITG